MCTYCYKRSGAIYTTYHVCSPEKDRWVRTLIAAAVEANVPCKPQGDVWQLLSLLVLRCCPSWWASHLFPPIFSALLFFLLWGGLLCIVWWNKIHFCLATLFICLTGGCRCKCIRELPITDWLAASSLSSCQVFEANVIQAGWGLDVCCCYHNMYYIQIQICTHVDAHIFTQSTSHMYAYVLTYITQTA